MKLIPLGTADVSLPTSFTAALTDGVGRHDFAARLLAAFQPGDKALTVTELAERTRLYKSTVLRLLASLAHGGLLRRTAEGQIGRAHV